MHKYLFYPTPTPLPAVSPVSTPAMVATGFPLHALNSPSLSRFALQPASAHQISTPTGAVRDQHSPTRCKPSSEIPQSSTRTYNNANDTIRGPALMASPQQCLQSNPPPPLSVSTLSGF
ncbi:hypothetical protein Vafri_16208 [Volvox africanus]|uniref:Uncharacterized protein n=1 Tax=Volvox africanus TaxID=51714 RepID=A0A8J4BHY9_9CHLO|nr:hypothetical protein Vafri_16208 [Volvox africanus]